MSYMEGNYPMMKFLQRVPYFPQVRQLYLSSRPKPWRLEKPVVLQFPVNDICNSKCQMCNIWAQKLDTQITPNQLEQALSNPLFSEVKSVGINGGEPTLRADLAELVETLYRVLPQLSTISLITNAFNSKQVIQRISEVGEVVKKHGGFFDVMVSLDGIEDIHDRVRGRKGNFENALKVIDFIQFSDLVHNTRLGCTVIKENVYGVHDLLEFALSKNIYIKYRVGIPHQRLYSKEVTDPFTLSMEERYHLAIFLMNLTKNYETSDHQNFFYKSLVDQLIYGKPRAAGCDWQHRGATLTARGELMYCAVESNILGSAITTDAEKLYTKNYQHLNDIVTNKCGTCLHDYTGLPPFGVMVKNYIRKGLQRVGVSKSRLRGPVITRLRAIKQDHDFYRRMKADGINLDALSSPKPATRALVPLLQNQKILICGWYGTETLGDKAILGGVLHALQAAVGPLEAHIASIEPFISRMTASQMPELVGSQIYSLAEALATVDQMDLVVFGGGPIMAINELSPMLAIFQKATQKGIPTIIAGCGVGPLGSKPHTRAIKQLLEHSSLRIYRDQKSLDVAASLGIDTSRDLVAEDPALTWLSNQATPVKRIDNLSPDDARPRLLLGLRDWPFHEYARDISQDEAQKLKRRCEKQIVSALEQLVALHPGLSILPYPMCTNHLGGDDRWFYRELFRGNQVLAGALDWSMLEAEQSPSEAVQTFRSADVALTMRFHSLVFALGLGIPAVSIDYTLGRGKVKSLADKHEVPQMSLDAVTAELIVKAVTQELMVRKELKDRLFPPVTFPELLKKALGGLVTL